MSASKLRTTRATSNRTPWNRPNRPTPQCALNAATVKSRSDTDALGKQLAVVGRIPQVDLGALRALEVQVRRVLPREADATVDLNVLGGRVEVRFRAVRLGERRHRRQLVVHLGRAPRAVVRRALGRLDLEEHVR